MRPWGILPGVKARVLFACILFLTGLVVLFCLTQLERVPVERWVSPSRDALVNPYLALDRWLEAAGIGSRILAEGDLKILLAGPEKTVFVQTSCFDWSGDQEALTGWIREGGNLFVAWDAPDRKLSGYLEGFGVTEGGEYGEAGGGKNTEGTTDPSAEGVIFFLDGRRQFRIGETKGAENVRVLRSRGLIRLVSLEAGKGSLTITGEPYFLHSSSLRDMDNAGLAWDLILGRSRGRILFFRGSGGERRFFGALLDRGNPAAFVLAALLLTGVGFWMAIPLFGRFKPVRELPGRPLRERFLAEGRFFKKYLGSFPEPGETGKSNL
jgi:hypothetical protein